MAKITIKEPDGPYEAILNTQAMNVELREVYLGVTFITEDNIKLRVFMRDGGYEIYYDDKKLILQQKDGYSTLNRE